MFSVVDIARMRIFKSCIEGNETRSFVTRQRVHQPDGYWIIQLQPS